jgi:glutamate 5-kinase
MLMNKYSRIVVKVGSNLLTRDDGTLDVTRMSSLTDQIASLRQSGIEVIMVSSGAVASGRSELSVEHKLDSLDQRQLFSAVGQAKLINRYYELFRDHHIVVGQVLTMKENLSTRRHYLNQKNCMEVMLRNGVIPIVNENDTLSVTELMFTDNDELSGLIASMMNAQHSSSSAMSTVYTTALPPTQHRKSYAPSPPTPTCQGASKRGSPPSAAAVCSRRATSPIRLRKRE